MFTHGTDPTKADTDGDSLSDSAELNVYHTNPLQADTDGDGLSDGFEVRAGRVVSWGGYDQSTVPPGLSVATAIAAGYAHSLAMKWNGTVVGWGADWYGQSSVPAGLSNVIAVSAGGYHSLALRADGTVVGWGYNSDNQANVPAGLNNVVAIAAGGYHSLALLADGTVVGWGYNGYGQVNVPAGLNNVVAIAAGGHHSLALRADGTVVGWGYNNDGPASVPAGLNNVVALADGGHHSLVLLADGTVVGWGADWYGQATIPAGLDGVIAITAGAYHSMALKSDGTAAGWGDNSYGQASAASGLNSVTALSGGYAHSLALVRVLNPTNADTDGDGLSDAWEVTHDLNPAADDAQADPDNDGLTNLQESQHGTDPHNADTDGDSLSDGDEVNVYGTDPTKADTDGDGDSDADELLTYGTDPLDPADNHVTVKTRVSFTFLARGEEPAPAAEGTSRPFILAPGQGRYVKVHVLPLSNQTFTLRLERIGGTLGAAGFDPAGQGTTIEGVTGTCFVPVYGLEACDLENNIRLSSEICGLARGATNLTVVNVTVTNAPSVVCLGEDYNLTVGLSCPLTQTNIQLSVVRLAGTNGAASLRDPLRSLAATNSLPLSNSCGITLHGDALSPAPDNLALLALVDGDQVLSAPFTVAGFTMTQPHSLWEGETQSVTVAVMPAMPVSLELQTLDDAGQPCTDWDRGRAVFDNNASSVELPAGGAAGIVGVHYSERANNIRLVARLGATASSNQPCFTVVKTFIDAQNPAAYIPCNGTRSIHVETRPVLPVANVLLRLSPQGDGAAVFTAGGGAEVAVTGAQGDYVVRGQSASYRANDIRLSLIVDGQERAYRELCVLGVSIVPFRTIGMRDDICYETTVGVTPWSLNDTASVMLVLRDANGGTPAASFSSLPSDNYIYLAEAFRNYTWYDNYGYGWGSVRFWGHRPSLAACDTLLDVVIDGQVCVATNFTVVDLVVSNFAIVPEGRTRSIPVQVLPNDTNVSVAVDLVGWYNDEATFADGQTHAVISGATNLVLRGVRANSEPDTTWLVATSDDGSGWWRGIFFVRRSFTVARVAWDRLGLLAVNENRDVPIEVAPAGSWTNITVALTPSSPTAGAACFDDNGTNRTIPGSSIQQVKGVALSDATGSIRLSATVDGIECKSDDFQVYSFQLGGSSGGLSNIVSELSCGVLCGASKSISVSMTPWPSGRDVRLGLATLEGQGKVTFDPAGQQSELTMTAPGSFPLHAHNPSSQPNNIGLNIRIADGSGMNSVVRNPDANALHARQTAGASKQRSSFKNVESEVGGGGDIINETVRFTAIQVGYSPQSFGTIMVWDNLSLDVSITPELSTNAPLTVTINSNVAAYLTHSCSLGLPTWPSGEYEVGGTLADGTPALGVSYTVYEHGWSYSLDAPSAMPTGTVAQIALHYRCICGETGAVSDVSYTFKGQPVSDNILQAGSEIGVFDLLAYTGGNSVKTSSVTVFMEGADSFEPALSEDGILSATGTFSSNPHVTGGAMTMYPYAYENLAAGDYMFVGFGTYSELLECCVRVIEISPADTTDQTPSSQSSSPGNNPDNSSSKDPIDTRNGNVSLTERDLAVPCPGLGLQWSRMYQSITSNPVFNQAYRYPQVARESGTLGPGWSHSYNWRLVFTNYVHAELRPTNGEKQPYLMNMEYWHQVARIGTNMYWLDALFDRDELGFLRGTSAAMLPGLGAITYQWKTNIVRQLLVLKSWDGEEYHFTRTFEPSDETTNRFSPHDWTEGDIVPPAGLNRTPTWDNNNGCYEFTLPGEPSMRFDANGRLSEMRDAWNNRVALTYTGSLLTRVAHNNGQALALSYGAGRLTNVVVEGGGPAMSYAYDSQGRLSEATRQASGVADETTRYEYDPFLSTRVNPAGHCYRYAYTEHNDLTPSVRGSGMALYESETATAVQYYAHSVSYGSTPSICYRRNGVDQRFDYSFDVNGSLTGIHGPLDTNGVGPLLSYTFDSGGNIATARTDDPAGGEWMVQSAVYGSNRNPLAVGFGYNAEPANWWSLAWDDAERNPVRITDPEGRVTEMDYIGDQLAHVRTGVGSATTSETALAYTSAGLLAAVTNANGHWVRYEHDQWGNPARVTPQVGPEIVSAFNRLGHLTSLVMPGNRTTMFNPDALGRVHAVTWPDGQSEQFQYDALGNMTNHTDRAGRSTQMTWLPTRKLASVTRWLGSQAVSIRSDYDQQFNTLRITDPLGRNVEGYQLDLQDRPVAVTNIDGQTMQIHYGVGSIVHSIDRFDGSTVSNYYDGEARVTRQTSGSLTTTYDYFRDGSLSGAANEAGAVTMAYDALNRLVALSNAVPNGALTYGYDLAGNVTGVVSAAGATHYEYDEAERLTRQSTPAGDFGYAFNVTNGLVASVSNTVNGLTRRTEYDVLDRLTQMNWLDGTGDVVRSYAYQYSLGGMITNLTRETGERTAYTYDDLDRLVGERKANATGTVYVAAYSYDLAGNRTQQVVNGVTNTATLGTGNKLASWAAGTSIGYDLAGNVTNLTGGGRDLALTWNDRYQVSSVSVSGQVAETYGFDALGRRVAISDGVTTNYMVYDGADAVADVAADGSLIRSYTFGSGVDNIQSMTVHGATTSTYSTSRIISEAFKPLLTDQWGGRGVVSVRRVGERSGGQGRLWKFHRTIGRRQPLSVAGQGVFVEERAVLFQGTVL